MVFALKAGEGGVAHGQARQCVVTGQGSRHGCAVAHGADAAVRGFHVGIGYGDLCPRRYILYLKGYGKQILLYYSWLYVPQFKWVESNFKNNYVGCLRFFCSCGGTSAVKEIMDIKKALDKSRAFLD